MEQTQSAQRIESIDILRGIVMVLMALDHVRDYFHLSAGDPLDLATTTPSLFFTRWITHYCAPVFVFLSGISVYLQSRRKTIKELSGFLIKRGLWLILLECTVVTFGWTFNPQYPVIVFQVIWAIGISMLLLGCLIHLPYRLLLFTGLAIVALHNLLDIPEAAPGFKAGTWWEIVHAGGFIPFSFLEGHGVFIAYPFLPWLGLMVCGYCMGRLFTADVAVQQRRKYLLLSGGGLLLLFILLRWSNWYGDPETWTLQHNGLYTLFSFVKVHKYPPSLLYMCLTIGPALLALALLEQCRNRFTDVMKIYGRVAMFYYLMHLYLIHIVCMALFFIRGHQMSEAYDPSGPFSFYFLVHGEGFGLPGVYLVWLLIVVALYPLCRWYDRYKTAHREYWWLSYL